MSQSIRHRRLLKQVLRSGVAFGLLLLLSSYAEVGPDRANRRRPNIIMIMVDDMGYSDIGCYGAEIRTPNIDWLAAHGVRFTQFYNNAVCTPTRASLLTGRYAHQAGLASNNTWPSYNPNLSEAEHAQALKTRGNNFWQHHKFPAYNVLRTDTCTTIGHVLRAAGYQTFLSGKWHVGDEKRFWPVNQGFDRSFVMIWGGGGHFKPPWAPYALDDQPFTEFPDDFYTTDYFFKYAMQFIEQSDPAKPYFVYLTPSAPHAPFQAWPEDIKKYDGVYDVGWEEIRRQRLAKQIQLGLYPPGTELPPWTPGLPAWASEPDKEDAANSMEVMAAMVDRVDQKIGELIALLRRRGELDNTVIMFFSDNGGTPTSFGRPLKHFHSWGEARNTPCSKMKGWMHEGGMRSPLVVAWPGQLPANVINHDQVGHVIDILPTCLELAGGEYPKDREPPEGISLLPALRNPHHATPRTLYWELSGGNAIRVGDWKLVREFTDQYFGKGEAAERSGRWALYNVRTDPGEVQDLIGKYPERAREMEGQYFAWEKRVGVVPHEQIKKLQAEFRATQTNQKEK